MKKEHIMICLIITALFLTVLLYLSRDYKKIDSGIVIRSWIQFPYETSHSALVGAVIMHHTTHHLFSYNITVRGQNKWGDTINQTFYLNKNQWDTIIVGMYLSTKDLNYIEPTK